MKIYEWPYLKETSTRGKILLNIIKPYLKSGDSFLDIMCGYSPLAGPLLGSGHRIAGFDVNPHPITYLRKCFPTGEWYQTSHENVHFKGFSVFLLLGAYEVCCEPSFQESLLNLLRLNNPRFVFLEANKGSAETPKKENPFVDPAKTLRLTHLRGYNCVLRLLMETGYTVLDVGEYDAGIEYWASVRIYAIMGRNLESKSNNSKIFFP
jgi:hypothetical protein